MPYTLCVYYSRTGNTRRVMQEVAQELHCEMVELTDGEDRTGLRGWLRSGMQAMSREIPRVNEFKTMLPLSAYDLVIVGTPVWAGRCSAPVRSFLQGYGQQIRRVAYVITRGSGVRYEEVFQQMDIYTSAPHISAVSIRPGDVGSAFWLEEFLTSIRGGGKEKTGHAG